MSYFWDFLKEFSQVFLPLFVAMDPLSVLPFLVSFVAPMEPDRRQRVIRIALLTGLLVGLFFLGLGRALFLVLGITIPDFLIAGGVILLVLALRELLSSGVEPPPAPNELLAVVPIGTPLLVGPATISLLILLSGLFSIWLVVLAFLANMLVAWAAFAQSQRIVAFLGEGGLRAFSKVAYLLLAAIAVQLIRMGISEIFVGLRIG
ncbi:MAG: MarC family protein [Chloroflexi bacterium]|nr:MarC family protein [Chloroflexota bacterium]